MEHVVATAQDPGPLEGEDVERLLHHAQPIVVAAGIEADRDSAARC